MKKLIRVYRETSGLIRKLQIQIEINTGQNGKNSGVHIRSLKFGI